MNVEERYLNNVEAILVSENADDEECLDKAFMLNAGKRETRIHRQMRARRRIEELREQYELKRLTEFPFTD